MQENNFSVQKNNFSENYDKYECDITFIQQFYKEAINIFLLLIWEHEQTIEYFRYYFASISKIFILF